MCVDTGRITESKGRIYLVISLQNLAPNGSRRTDTSACTFQFVIFEYSNNVKKLSDYVSVLSCAIFSESSRAVLSICQALIYT